MLCLGPRDWCDARCLGPETSVMPGVRGPETGVMPGVRPHLGAEHAGEAGGALGAVGARGAHRTRDQLRVHVPVRYRVIVSS